MLFLFLFLSAQTRADFLNASVEEEADEPSPKLEQIVVGGEAPPEGNRFAKSTVRVYVTKEFEGLPPVHSICSGTVLSGEIILTAAHCLGQVNPPLPKKVSVIVTTPNEKLVGVSSFVIHPGYKVVKKQTLLGEKIFSCHDIGLLKLQADISPVSEKAVLPSRAPKMGEVEKTTIAGFGKVNPFLKSDESFHIGDTEAGLREREGCEPEIRITGSAQACSGDSGGPVYRVSEKRLTVLGVLATQENMCSANGSATSVSHHLEWIRQEAKHLAGQQDI